WARDLVLDFGGRDGLCADDTRLSRPPSRNDSPTRRKECPARKAISLATLESLQSQGKNYAARLEGRQGAELGIDPAYGELGAQKGRRATVTTGSVEASPLAVDDGADYGLAACCCCSCSCRCRRSRSCSSCCCRSCSCRFLASKEGC